MNQESNSHQISYRDDKPSHSTSASLSHPVGHKTEEIYFTSDRKGDIQNLRYGGIDKYKVPRYRTAGYGRLIGLDRRFRVVSDAGSVRQIHDQSLDSANKDRTFPQQLKQQSKETSSLPIRSKLTVQDDLALQKDYVVINTKRRRVSADSNLIEQIGSNGELASGADGSQFAADGGYDSESAKSSFGDEDDQHGAFDSFKNHPDNRRYLELKNRTERNPSHLDAWIDLIEHQERYFLFTAGSERVSPNASQKRAIADARITLYEKAVDAVKDQAGREKLILNLMKEGAQIWDTNKQQQEWKSVLRQSTSVDLWLEYLNFEQSNTVTFSYETCLATYLEVIKVVLDSRDKDFDCHSVYVALRLTTFMYEAGYSERAIALWQGLLEYNFLCPRDTDRSLDAFQAFWEAENLRIGEEGAKGWRSSTQPEIHSHADEPLAQLTSEDLLHNWEVAERERSKNDNMPARMIDETVEDDPYRVILFSDIKDFLFRTTTARGKKLLKQAFLKFCRLPLVVSDDDDNHEDCYAWCTDPFLYQSTIDSYVELLTDADALFHAVSDRYWEVALPSHYTTSLSSFATRALVQLVEADRDDEPFAEYTIILLGRQDVKQARKLAKSLLKHRSNDLLLYNAYALLEVRSGKVDVANNVWLTSLSMTESLGLEAQHQKFILWHSWIWALLDNKEYGYVLALLTEALPSNVSTINTFKKVTAQSAISARQHLQADAYYRDQISSNLGRGSGTMIKITSLFAILKYLQNEFNIDVALQVYDSALSLVNDTRSCRFVECIHQERAKLVHFHATVSKSAYRPKQLVTLFDKSVVAFPDNFLFFVLHETYLRRTGIVDRVRSLDLKELQSRTRIIPFLKVIIKEMSRPAYSGSTVHSIRHAFASATDATSPLRHCPSIWLAWLQWESSLVTPLSKTDGGATHLKAVYLSALRYCPWCKELYMYAFNSFVLLGAIGEKEMRRVYRSMSERGLRIRNDITEVLDEQTGD